MIRFTTKLVLFLLPLAVLVGAVEMLLARIPNSYNTRKAHLERRLADVEILITGNSHANHAIRPAQLSPRAFSLANAAQDLYYDAMLVQKYLPRMPRLRLVIVSVSYHSFEYRLCEALEPWRCGFYSRVYGIARPGPRFGVGTDELNALLLDTSYIALYGPKDVRRFAKAGFRVDLSHEFDETGWRISKAGVHEGEISPATATRRLARHHSMVSVDRTAANVAVLDELFTALRARGVAPVLVTTPVYATYAAGIDPERYRRMQETVRDLAARHGLEYRNHLLDSDFRIEDFMDNDHLNATGASKFTERIRREVVSRYVDPASRSAAIASSPQSHEVRP